MKCKYCEGTFDPPHHSTKYCQEDCRRLSKNEMHRKGREIKESKENYSSFLLDNILKCVKEDYHLTTKGFDLVSEIGFKAYINHFNRMIWLDILKMVSLDNKLINYIVDEYKQFNEKSRKQSFHTFCKEHEWITYSLLESINMEMIRECACVQKRRYTDEELRMNFLSIKEKIGRIPLYQEFEELTKISLSTYTDRFKLRGEVYNKVFEKYFSDIDISDYHEYRKQHKSMVSSESGKLALVHLKEDYEVEFHRVFKLCIEEYGEYPSKRLFNRLSKFNERTYRKKFGTSWTNVCLMYGYKIDNSHKSESKLLNLIKKITGKDYIPQKTFYWLKSETGYPLFCDGYFKELSLVVEFDGVQHRIPVDKFGGQEGLEKLQRNDAIKDMLIPKKGFKLLRIDSRDNWHDSNYIIRRLNDIGINVDSI